MTKSLRISSDREERLAVDVRRFIESELDIVYIKMLVELRTELDGAYVVVASRNASGDIEVPVLDCAALLLGEQLGAVGDGDVLLRLVGHEVDLEAVEARRLARARCGGALVEVAVSRYLVYLSACLQNTQW